MSSFTYTGHPARVVFGDGTLAELPAELDRLGARRAVVISTREQGGVARELQELLGGKAAGACPLAVMHTPTHVTEDALARIRELGADALVAVGGGSAIGLAKALALRTDLPQVAVPTTYAGSEMTPILGETRDGVKTTLRSPKVLPEVVLYDVALTLSLPVHVSAVSGLNAMAHAVEALYAADRNPIVDHFAVDSLRVLARALPRLVADAADRSARWDALYGACLAGICLGAVGMGLHHKLCHTLGGSENLPHAETHAVVLPHAVAYNAAAAPLAIARVATAIEAPNAARGLFDLAGRLGVARSLRELGMTEPGIDRAVALALAGAYPNPAPLEETALRALLRAAWAGQPPAETPGAQELTT